MKMQQILAFSMIPLLLLVNVAAVSAKNIALAVASANSLDPIFEQPIYNILKSMNHTVTPFDQNSNINLANYDLLVVAGRPPKASPMPASFMQNLPVNSMPTVAIDYYNLYNWGWAASGGVNDMQSGSQQSIYIASNTHPITAGYSTGQRVFMLNQSSLDATDLVAGTSNFTFVAYLDQQGDGGVAFAAPNTQLANGNKIGSNTATVYFGISYPAYWTSDAVNIFENAVNWVTNLNFNSPTTPTLTGPTQALTTSAQYSWSASTGANGVQSYEIQVSRAADFSQIITDTQTSSLSYTQTKLQDGMRYYARVRAVDFLNLHSNWSNTVSTIADFSPIILTINSPTSGSTFNLGDTFNVDVSVNSQRIQQGAPCTVNIDQDTIGTLSFNQTTGRCSGSMTVPQNLSPGPSSTSLTITAVDEFGATNSTSIPIIIANRPASSSTTSTTSQTSTETTASSSSGSTGGSAYYAIFDVIAPQIESYYVNSQNTFTIVARNDGNAALHSAKVSIVSEGSAFSASIVPDRTYDLLPGESTTYTITIAAPSQSGDYYLDVRSLSYETTETVQRILIHVKEQSAIVDFGITSIEIPDFANGVTALANITIVNKGNVVGTANLNLTLPDGWTASATTASQDILPNQQATLAFEITPTLNAGNITFSGTFSDGNTTKEFSYPVAVSAKENPNPLATLTGSIVSTLGNPAIAIPTIIAASVAVALYYKLRNEPDFASKYIWPKRIKASWGKVAPKTHQKNNFSGRKIIPSSQTQPSHNSSYDKWEKKFGRS